MYKYAYTQEDTEITRYRRRDAQVESGYWTDYDYVKNVIGFPLATTVSPKVKLEVVAWRTEGVEWHHKDDNHL